MVWVSLFYLIWPERTDVRNLFELRHVLKMGFIWQKVQSDMGCGRCSVVILTLDGEGSTRDCAMFLPRLAACHPRQDHVAQGLARRMHHVRLTVVHDSVGRRRAEREGEGRKGNEAIQGLKQLYSRFFSNIIILEVLHTSSFQ